MNEQTREKQIVSNEDGNSLIGSDIVLEVQFLGFNNEEVVRKMATVIERATPIPCERHSGFLKRIKVPLGGTIHLKLFTSTHEKRTIFEVHQRLKWRKWYHYPLGIYNETQKALRHIPFVGKTFEDIAPDAWQKTSLLYSLKVSDDKTLEYEFTIGKRGTPRLNEILAGTFSL